MHLSHKRKMAHHLPGPFHFATEGVGMTPHRSLLTYFRGERFTVTPEERADSDG
jgi:hypothetical protein